MCGICGFAGFNDDVLLEKMCFILAHRGPDDSGMHIDRANKVSLGHRRLSIIDLEGGKQPIFNETGKIVVVFNGEIYNFPELKKELEGKGHIFKTHSDTEVLVHLYEEHGFDMPNLLNGIFSFVIVDQEKLRVFGVRDNFGIKPLFYHYRNNRLLFASEIKALLLDDQVAAGINHEALHYTLNLRFIPGAQSLFKDIYRVPAGHYFLFDLNSSKMTINRYWNQPYAVIRKMTEDEAIEGIRFHLRQAVKRQLISDVPIGAYLSGGLDSSAIVAFASEFRSGLSTFSMGFGEPTDEVGDARRVSDHFRTDFHETFIKMDPLESLKEVIWYVEEPKVNILQGYYLSQFARQHVKVALSGLGGDELFAGYVNNKFLNPLQSLHALGRQGGIRSSLSRALFQGENKFGDLRLDEVRRGLQLALAYGDKTRFYLILRNVWDYDDGFYDNVYSHEMNAEMMKYRTGRLFEQFFSDQEDTILGQSLNAEFNTKMVDDFLLNEDRTSMAHALEVRVPFLDKDLVKFAFSIPTRLKIKNNSTKYIFKKAMKGILPDFVLNKKKWGFAINPYHQFQKDLKKVAMEVLNERKIKSQGILNWNYINKIINHPVSPRLRWHYYYLWQLIGFQYWHETFIENKTKAGGIHAR